MFRDLPLRRSPQAPDKGAVAWLMIVSWLSMILPAMLAVATIIQPEASNLIVLRDGLLLLSIPVLLFAAQKSSRVALILIFASTPFLLLIGLQLVRDGAPLVAKFASTRQLVSPILLLLFGILAAGVADFYSKFLPNFIRLLAFLATFGIFERVTHFWKLTGTLPAYFETKRIGILESGYPFIFIEPSSFSEFSEHSGLLRATSTLLDPINFGHTMVAAVILLVLIRREAPNAIPRRRYLFLWFLFTLAAVLSLSKGAILQLAMMALMFKTVLPIPVLRMPLMLIGLGYGIAYVITHPGFLLHLGGVREALGSASVFGLGLARAGNYATIFNTSTSGVGDTFIGAVFGQIGLIGLTAWLLPFAALSAMRRSKQAVLPLMLLWSQIGVSVISENAFNLGSIFANFIVATGFLILEERRRTAEESQRRSRPSYQSDWRHAGGTTIEATRRDY